MRAVLSVLAATGVLLASAVAFAGNATAAGGATIAPVVSRHARAAQAALSASISGGLRSARRTSGAYVVDLSTGQTLFSSAPNTPRLPASVEKVYTTATALLRLGAGATLNTNLLGSGYLDSAGTWHGTVYLRGAGDPTFGSVGYDRSAYGTGATVEQLVANLHAAGVNGISGAIEGDESLFDSRRGTPPYGYRFALDVEGSLSALSFNRGLTTNGSAYIPHPALYAAQQLALAARAAGIRVPAGTSIGAAVTPAGAQMLASVPSPPVATLIQLTNTPSDNFFAEMLLKDLGAKFGGRGSTAAGAAVVRAELAKAFKITPRLEDGSGLSRNDFTTPKQVVSVLSALANNPTFVGSLAVGGESGTLADEMRGTAAQGRCRGKTGTLSDVANLVGYCQALDGHTLAFAFLMNGVGNPDAAHTTEARMAVALAKYNG